MSEARIFRCHLEVPDSIASPLLRRLASEWVDLNHDELCRVQLSRLDLAGCVTPGEVVDRIDLSATEEQNRLLLVLIEARTYLASRMVLQALLPGILNVARSRKLLSRDAQDECLQMLIADLWEAVDRYPTSQRTHVALYLLRKVRRTGRGLVPENHLGLEQIPEKALTTADDTDEAVERLKVIAELERIFDLALYYGVVTQDDLELLRETQLSGKVSREVAAERGLTAAAVRKRCERIRKNLALVTN